MVDAVLVETKKIEIMNCQRVDIFIRLLFIDYFFKKNDFGERLYRKTYPPHKDTGEVYFNDNDRNNYVNKFKKLIKSFVSQKFNKNMPLKINKNYELFNDGAHRLSCCIYFKIPVIPCIIIDKKIRYCRYHSENEYPLKYFNSIDKNIVLKGYRKYISDINGLNIPINMNTPSLSRLKHIKN
jgi:hypothetical protein